jgi:hypothetical protein
LFNFQVFFCQFLLILEDEQIGQIADKLGGALEKLAVEDERRGLEISIYSLF